MSLARLVAAFYFLAVVIYATWGVMEGRGLPGLMTTWMFETFDWSSDELTGGLTALILLAPMTALRRWFDWSKPATKAETALLYLVLVATPTLLGFGGGSYLIAKDAEESRLELETYSLPKLPLPDLGEGRHLVRLEGGYLMSQTQHYVREEYGEEHVYYVPFVASEKADAVGMVVVVKGRGEFAPVISSSGRFLPLKADQPFLPATLDGIASSGTVPLYVEKAWAEDGLRLLSPCYLVEPRMLVNDRLPSRLGYLRPDHALYFGLFFSATLILGLGLGFLIRHIRQR